MLDDYEPSEKEMIAQAVEAAVKAYNGVFNKYNVDYSYYRLGLVIEVLGTDLETVLRKVTYEDLA